MIIEKDKSLILRIILKIENDKNSLSSCNKPRKGQEDVRLHSIVVCRCNDLYAVLLGAAAVEWPKPRC